ncbi:hypothetical protein ACFE04_030132 [Oxalis oulophora]
MKLFTCSWVPEKKEAKALVFICHGYAMECSITMNSTGNRLAKAGYAVYGIDYEGHGKSGGLHGFINHFDHLVDDCTHHFTDLISERENNKGKLRYLLGESMGGAMALLLSRKKPNYYWDGVVLVAPMCKIADEMKPSLILVTVLSQTCKIIPTWTSFQGRDILDLAFKQKDIRHKIRENPYCYKGSVRLKTAYELLRVSTDLEHRLHEPRLRWTVELHECFVDAVTQLGGPDRLVPCGFLLVGLFFVSESPRWLNACLVLFGHCDLKVNFLALVLVDAYQYNRIYSPATFGKKYDPNGNYIRHFLPILKDMPREYIYEPWTAPLSVQTKAKCIVGKDYPKHVVFHDSASKECKSKMGEAYELNRRLSGQWEPLENINIVFTDIINWLDERVELGNSRFEWQQKLKNDKMFPKTTQQEAL